MRAHILAMALLLGLSAPVAAQEAVPTPAAPAPAGPALQPAPPAVVVRQSLDPASGAVIGQHVALMVDVMFRGEMPRPPRVSLPDVPGVQVLRFETQATTLRETIDGADYVGQRFEFALYARRGGTFPIPPAAITLLDREGERTGTASGQSVPLEVNVPPGVDASTPVVATRRLTLVERWAPEPGGAFTAGDALVRTITRTAEDVPGLAMRDLALPAPEGVRAYVDPPDISDRSNRGMVSGQRMDRVTYMFERGGRFELPAAEQPWWDLGANLLRTELAPGATLTVAAPPPEAAAAGGGTSRRTAWIATAVAVLAVLAFCGWQIRRAWAASARRAEREAFAALRRACASTDARAAYDAFARWRRFLDPARRTDAAAALAPLEAALFAEAPSAWDAGRSGALFECAAGLRRPRRSRTARDEALPPLNP